MSQEAEKSGLANNTPDDKRDVGWVIKI